MAIIHGKIRVTLDYEKMELRVDVDRAIPGMKPFWVQEAVFRNSDDWYTSVYAPEFVYVPDNDHAAISYFWTDMEDHQQTQGVVS